MLVGNRYMIIFPQLADVVHGALEQVDKQDLKFDIRIQQTLNHVTARLASTSQQCL